MSRDNDVSYALPDRLKTARYALRRVLPSDAEAIFRSYAADPQVTRYLGWRPHQSAAETRDFLRGAAREWQEGTGCPMVIAPAAAPQDLIGMVHPRLLGPRVSYGYVLAARAWGQGAASEILTALVEHALRHPRIFRTEAFCDTEHRASARVMEKAGMTREGVLRRFFLHPNLSDAPRDCLLYARVR